MPTLHCLGDSLTYGLGVRSSKKWTSLVATSGWELNNLGICGDTTGGMLARAQALTACPCYSQAPETRPGVFLLGGTNDILFSGSATAARANMAALTHQLTTAGYRVLVGLPLPIFPEDAPEKWAALANFPEAAGLLRDYCGWLLQFSYTFELPAVNFYTLFEDHPEWMADGLHPNAEGHSQMARLLEGALQCL